ncbi:hypothetical protein RBB78_08095 [Tunturiibacter empetritectus]|uniref:hypothetical protein n=1 Tax=Tunturiibacter empetritectus TaxID=3069691 RepID=UPI003D9BEE61
MGFSGIAQAKQQSMRRSILLKVIRPQLDEVQQLLIAELMDTAVVRRSKTSHADVAKAVGKYVSTHAHGGDLITASTLDRSLAGACTL